MGNLLLFFISAWGHFISCQYDFSLRCPLFHSQSNSFFLLFLFFSWNLNAACVASLAVEPERLGRLWPCYPPTCFSHYPLLSPPSPLPLVTSPQQIVYELLLECDFWSHPKTETFILWSNLFFYVSVVQNNRGVTESYSRYLHLFTPKYLYSYLHQFKLSRLPHFLCQIVFCHLL